MSNPPINHQHAVPCDLERARQFLHSEQLAVEDSDFVAHLDECDSCRHFLDQEAADEATWNDIKTLLQPDEFDQAGSMDFSAATIGYPVQSPVAAQDVIDALAPTDDPHRLGRMGTYEVTGVVGVGGMGVVLKAIDPSLDRVVAVKVMAPQLANNDNARRRFAREARAAAAVLHPNVIPIHSVASEGAMPYLVMAYVRGGSLQKRLEKTGPLSVIEVLRIGSQIAAGLAAAHEQGLIHRDIKPENILLEEGVERVTITDFGLARAVDDNTVTQNGAIAGTPMYMSPEQAQGLPLDHRSDLFSLGSVLYSLCTGQPPYHGDTSFSVMRQIIDDDPVPVQELNPDTPPWLAALIERLMSKDKEDRYQSAAEVHKLMDRCISHVQQPEAISLPPELLARPKQRVTRTPATRRMLLTCLAAVLAMAAGFVFYLKSGENEVSQSGELRKSLGSVDELFVHEGLPHQMREAKLYQSERTRDDISLTGGYAFYAPQQPVKEDARHKLQQLLTDAASYAAMPQEPTDCGPFHPDYALSWQDKGEDCHLLICYGCNEAIFLSGKSSLHYQLRGILPKLKPIFVQFQDKRPADQQAANNSAADTKSALVEADLKALQGTWRVTYSEDSGRVAPQESLRDLQFEFEGSTMKMKVAGQSNAVKFSLDASTKPKSIDLSEKHGTKPGIYDIQGDTLRICISETGEQRPTQFDSQPDSANDVIIILKRINPEEESQSTAEQMDHSGALTPELARALIPKAASISNTDFMKLSRDPRPGTIGNESLSLVLMSLDVSKDVAGLEKDFRFLVAGVPKPSDLAAAMALSRSKGYFSMIQPEYISECRILEKSETGRVRGYVSFNAPLLYTGAAIFEAGKVDGKWRIDRFQLQARNISVALGANGEWEREESPAPQHAPE